mmetsp:Transcript_6762/g.15634  ORF Transcript_6762/g.15634 Transcript_6762/m.15634 type:complete len:203 (-) Transcript_6762:101-709(-)
MRVVACLLFLSLAVAASAGTCPKITFAPDVLRLNAGQAAILDIRGSPFSTTKVCVPSPLQVNGGSSATITGSGTMTLSLGGFVGLSTLNVSSSDTNGVLGLTPCSSTADIMLHVPRTSTEAISKVQKGCDKPEIPFAFEVTAGLVGNPTTLYIHYGEGDCNTGLQSFGGVCMDLNECKAGTHSCGVYPCTNTAGSFTCEMLV